MLLIQKKRFQFNKSYVYGSAAFIVGFAAVMAILVHNAPIRVSNAESGVTSETAKKEAPSDDAAKPAQTNDAPAVVAMPTTNGSQTTRPSAVNTTPAPVTPATPTTPVVTTPTTPVTPTVPDVPVIPEIPPVVTDPPIIDIDLPLPVLPIDVEISL